MGSRYGGIKQIEPLGEHGELIIDYSIYDAVLAKFDKVVFVIRRDIEKDFCDRIFNRIKKHIKAEYVFQDIDVLPGGYTLPAGRTKPWGTVQAILAARDVIDAPFCMINADDFYGREAFQKIAGFLEESKNSESKHAYASVGYKLVNTLSDTGSVSRGVCEIDENDMIVQINETLCIQKLDDKIVSTDDGVIRELSEDIIVSTNFFGLTPDIMPLLEQKFIDFLKVKGTELKAEYPVPVAINDLMKAGTVTMKNFSTDDAWLGFTYPEDKITVTAEIKKMTQAGTYPSPLWKCVRKARRQRQSRPLNPVDDVLEITNFCASDKNSIYRESDEPIHDINLPCPVSLHHTHEKRFRA